MKRTMKTGMAWLLVAVMILGILPVFAQAEDTMTPLDLGDVCVTYTNPILGAAPAGTGEQQTRTTSEDSDIEYHYTTDSAGAALREGLKAKEAVIAVGFSTDYIYDGYLEEMAMNFLMRP